MKIHLERLSRDGVGVILVDCPQILLNLFPAPEQHPLPPFSVLMLDDDIPPEGDLTVQAERLRAITVGVPGVALLVGKSAHAWTPANADEPPVVEAPPPPRAAGDLDFLAAAEAKLRRAELKRDLGGLVERIRALQPTGTLRMIPKGLSRRYVNVPDNFVGFTLQSQAIVVHARRSGAARQSNFKISRERKPYISFRVRNAEELEAALPLIEASWRRGA